MSMHQRISRDSAMNHESEWDVDAGTISVILFDQRLLG